MTGTLLEIWRHPIKSHGRERISGADLTVGGTLPWDRVWAVANEASEADGSVWARCQNFSRGSQSPLLGAISATLDEATATITLTHPDREPLTFRPDAEPEKLIDWAGPMIPENRAQSARVIRAQTQAFTDSDLPSITLCNFSSHRAVEQRLGGPLDIGRWRGNLWIDGLGPWEEFEWMDREVQVGEAVLIPRERTDRCLATHNNPKTGARDADVLAALDAFGHRDFSVRAEVVRAGRIDEGCTVKRL